MAPSSATSSFAFKKMAPAVKSAGAISFYAMPAISAFIQRLARTETPPDVHNQYAGSGRPAHTRRANLHRYLRRMTERGPRVLLVGEAAGHRGCRLTGVPFTSEAILHQGVPAHGLFGSHNGYALTDERGRIVGEQTATIVWELLQKHQPLPLLWNALPFHPFRAGHPWSNRTPRVSELSLGRPFLHLLLDRFPIETVVAVGNKAEDALFRWCIPAHKVRHPSHGGKAQFTKGIRPLLRSQV